jgi:hypothetical protein
MRNATVSRCFRSRAPSRSRIENHVSQDFPVASSTFAADGRSAVDASRPVASFTRSRLWATWLRAAA